MNWQHGAEYAVVPTSTYNQPPPENEPSSQYFTDQAEARHTQQVLRERDDIHTTIFVRAVMRTPWTEL
jgi:hypothetical protein